MTNLERAREAVARIIYDAGLFHGWWPNKTPYEALDPISRSEFDGIIDEAFAAARREGAEEATLRAENAEATAYAWADADAYRRGAEQMRERARRATTFCCFECSRVIAALPLTPEEP